MGPNLEKPNTQTEKCGCGGSGVLGSEFGVTTYCGCDAGKRKKAFEEGLPAWKGNDTKGSNFDRGYIKSTDTDHLFPNEERPGGKRSTPPNPDNNARSAFDQHKDLGKQLDLFDES